MATFEFKTFPVNQDSVKARTASFLFIKKFFISSLLLSNRREMDKTDSILVLLVSRYITEAAAETCDQS